MHPTWDKLLDHIGKPELFSAMRVNTWATQNGIDARKYLQLWMYHVWQRNKVPYMFLWGPVGCGKTMFFEMTRILMNWGPSWILLGGLFGANSFRLANLKSLRLAWMDMDLPADAKVWAQFTDLLHADELEIHRRGEDPSVVENRLNFFHESDRLRDCPTEARVVAARMEMPEDKISKTQLCQALEAEQPSFKRTLEKMAKPEFSGELALPVIVTKSLMMLRN